MHMHIGLRCYTLGGLLEFESDCDVADSRVGGCVLVCHTAHSLVCDQ